MRVRGRLGTVLTFSLAACAWMVMPLPPVLASVAGGWSTSINGNADPDLIEVYNLLYPVVGDAIPGASTGGSAADDFCFVGGGRTYTTDACIRDYGAHSGNDIYAEPNVNDGVLRIVAAVPGTVISSGCAIGAGERVLILGTDKRYYRYFHMQRGTLGVVTGQSVVAGQKLGNMGQSSECPGGAVGQHLHFDISYAENSTNRARDPYPSLRVNFALPGHTSATDTTADSGMADAYNAAMQAAGGYPAGLGTVGWPGGSATSSDYSRPVLTSAASGTPRSDSGYDQWLTSGDRSFDGQGLSRSGMLGRTTLNSTGRWVRGLVFKRYSSLGSHTSYLGYPISGEFASSTNGNRTRQNFQGGCIVNNGSGYANGNDPYVAARYGAAPC